MSAPKTPNRPLSGQRSREESAPRCEIDKWRTSQPTLSWGRGKEARSTVERSNLTLAEGREPNLRILSEISSGAGIKRGSDRRQGGRSLNAQRRLEGGRNQAWGAAQIPLGRLWGERSLQHLPKSRWHRIAALLLLSLQGGGVISPALMEAIKQSLPDLHLLISQMNAHTLLHINVYPSRPVNIH